MKRLTWILLCVFLVSCSANTVSEDYFLEPRVLQVTFEHRGTSLTGRLETARDSLTFYPDVPKGLVITLRENGGEVRYGDMVFEGEMLEMTRLNTLYQAIKNKAFTITGEEYPLVFEGDGYKLTVHEELSE